MGNAAILVAVSRIAVCGMLLLTRAVDAALSSRSGIFVDCGMLNVARRPTRELPRAHVPGC